MSKQQPQQTETGDDINVGNITKRRVLLRRALINGGVLASILLIVVIVVGIQINNTRDERYETATSEAATLTREAATIATEMPEAQAFAISEAELTRTFHSEGIVQAETTIDEYNADATVTREQEIFTIDNQALVRSLIANSWALLSDKKFTDQELARARLLAVEGAKLNQELGQPQDQTLSQELLYTLGGNNLDASHLLTTLTAHFDRVMSVAWSPDGSYLASASTDNTVIIWDTVNWQPVITLGHRVSVYSVAWSPDGSHLASTSANKTVIIWDTESWQPVTTLTEHTEGVLSVAWSPDGSRLASASGENFPKGDNMIIIWDTESWQPLAKLTEHMNEVGSVAWSSSGSRLASASLDDTVIIWQVDKNQPDNWQPVTKLTSHTETVWSVAWKGDDSLLASASVDGTIIVWDTESWEPVTTLTNHTGFFRGVAVAWKGDGSSLASSSCGKQEHYICIQGKIIIWDMESWEPVTTLTDHTDTINSVAWNSDDSRLASASYDGTVKVWMFPDFLELQCLLAGRNLSLVEWEQFLPGVAYRCTCSQWPAGEGAPIDAPAANLSVTE